MRNDFPILFNIFGGKEKVSQEIEVLDNSILLSMLYFSHHTKPNGKFVYRINLNPDKKYSEKQYSSLRHAGTLYSMHLCETVLKNNVLQNKRYLASEYFLKTYVKRIDANMYGVVSKPEEEAPVLLATSGGTGLGLIALSNLLPEGKVRLSTLRKMGNFLLYMQAENGDFWPSYEFAKKDRSILHSARYYPGESCLGLLCLYEVDKDEQWLNAVKLGLLRLAKKASKKPDIDLKFDHWGLLALQKLFTISENGLTEDEKNLLVEFASKNARGILAKQVTEKKDEMFGSFTASKSLCGAGTIFEGLLAAYDCIEDKNLRAKILSALKAVSGFLSNHQIKTGPLEGGIPANPVWKTPQAKNADKEVRIDNVQHTISGWINYRNLLSK